MRDKPKIIDYLSLGIASIDILTDIVSELKKIDDAPVENFFTDDLKWGNFSFDLSEFFMNFVEGQEIYKKVGAKKIILGKIGKGVVGYSANEKDLKSKLYFLKETVEEIYKKIENEIWDKSKNLIFEELGKLVEDDDLVLSQVQETIFIGIMILYLSLIELEFRL